MDAKQTIQSGKAILGIEFGSTRIKAVLIDADNNPIAQGSHTWENQLVDGLWTYSTEAIWYGLQDCYADLRANVLKQYEVEIETLAAIGFSAMMHGYMPFKGNDILVPFRTWRNTNTGPAAVELSKLFNYNIPLRWSISHLYQAILNNEEHVKDIEFLTTLAGYVHWQVTGQKVLGVGDASGMIPVDPNTKTYDAAMVEKFDKLIAPKGFGWKLLDILPKSLNAGENAGFLTPEGALKLDVSGHLKPGIPVCPPEGDAGTGMVATNAVRQRTGNVSAGTSSFSMIVLEKELSKPYEMLDMVTTPDGSLVAMVHCNNCTSDINAWVKLFKEYQELLGLEVDTYSLYSNLFNIALKGDADCGGVISYNYKFQESEVNDTAQVVHPEIEKIRAAEAAVRHFGLSAQELQTIYPNLVYEGQDGYLSVNYIELVPVLIRSIQELQQEIESLKMYQRIGTTDIEDIDQMEAKLFQNNPNPFSQQTIIKFHIPENTLNSCIYIFDMQGKMQKQYPVTTAQNSITIDSYELPAGLYLYSLVINGKEVATKRMILSN